MFEPYKRINILNTVKIIIRFRSSCHDLKFERGGYIGVIAEDRKCFILNNTRSQILSTLNS